MLCDKEDLITIDYFNNLKSEFLKQKYKKYHINIIEEDKSFFNDNISLVIVISKYIKNINAKYDLYKFRKKDIPLYIIMNCLNTENIVEAINITPYVAYINRSVNKIVEKILTIGKFNEKNG